MGRIKSSRPFWRIAFRGSLTIIGARTMSGSSRSGSYIYIKPVVILEVKRIFQKYSLLYEAYALFLVAKGNLVEANEVYELGISRKAEPLDRLKKMHVLFQEQMPELAQKPVPETKHGAGLRSKCLRKWIKEEET
ncbi:mitotic spindle checkpoint protein BUBR1-like isoform X2 [Asparagus officinalis]|uniref:mitotic spindle checkpoint protein BUBR1-like isoform X2 n=1 Tax=Asparagus officinalis TaxID=4686 RepID=UPI00098E44CA|nr:mitotic spindle checkpoint protein BUBR1-like isoform X2 [Asparagus officinalis]